ncbi:MAG: hypothetical protein V2A34_00085 [Lentisphaerota bacterium]
MKKARKQARNSLYFDRSQLRLLPLVQRKHDLDISQIRDLTPAAVRHPALKKVAARILDARKRGRSVILMMGAHVLKSGVQRYLIDLMERGYLSCVAMNGAGLIHDYELALIGATTESVARYISEGQFGLWKETGRLNDLAVQAARSEMGLGEAAGCYIEKQGLPFKQVSVLAAGYRLGVPVTIHVGLGYDIVHEHPNCDGAAWGAASYRDFLRFAKIMEKLEGGVVMNFGSAVMAPEVYLKALAMVRNVARQKKQRIAAFTTLVCDLAQLPPRAKKEPPRSSAAYYFRPLKTMLIRTIADGGEGYYVMANHADSIPQLWTAINAKE